jgi:mannose-6-phosphate isomerase-like protein (cupin superfamily)
MATPISRLTATHYSWGDRCDGWHLLAEPGVSVIEERMPPGATEARHYHQRAAQLFYVLSGVATFTLDGEVHRVGARQGLSIPAGVVHVVANDGESPLEFVVVSVPPSHGDRVPVLVAP